MLSRVLTARLPSLHLIRSLSSQKLSVSPDITEKYGPHASVELPRLKDVIQYPVPPLHHDYENAWRRITSWATDYLEEQDDLLVIASWNVPYSIGWQFPHFNNDAYFAILKVFLGTFYQDWLHDTRWQKKKKQMGQELICRIMEKKYPKGAQFKRNIEMVIDSFRGLKPYITDNRGDEFKSWTIKYLTADLIQSANKGDHQTDIDKYIRHREISYSTEAQFKLMESLSGFVPLPDELRQDPDIKKVHDAAGQLMWLPNDMLSFKYEQANNDHWNNFVTVYARQNDVPLQEGINKLIDYTNEKIVEFQTQMWKIVNSDLVVKYPQLKDYLEVGLANMIYGSFQTYAVMGKYSGKMVYEKDPKRNDRIDPQELYSRIKSS